MSIRVRYLRQSLLLVGMAAALASAEGEPRKLLGHWRFDEGDGLVLRDAAGNGHDGQILNDSRGAKRVAGRNGGAIELTGGDQKERNQAGCLGIPGFENTDWSKGMTLELWVRFTKLGRPNTYELVSNTQSDRGKGFRFVVSWASLCLRSGEGDAGKTWGAQSEPSAITFGPGEWYHLAATYDGSVFRVYIDGLLAGESEPNLPLTRGESTLWVGAYRGGFAYGLNGIVDELKLYDYPRSAGQIVRDAKLGD
jgi:hypothetical protein